jgi:hypothetical protein
MLYLLMIFQDILGFILLNFKYEVFDKFVEFKTIVENIFTSKIKHFQSDGGKEFVNSCFLKLFASNGIMHRISCPHTLEQNGLAERKHRHIINIIRTLLC